MSGAEEGNNKGPREEELPPAASFNGSAIGPGSRIGLFRIERELGRGGAGIVYLALDTKLGRSVAIKSLPLEVTGNTQARARFHREARLLASLNHPNIATIFEEIEEAEGEEYLVFEYVPGQTLAERISSDELELNEVLSIALQIAEAMSAAHEKGVIHRDLKPSNVKITPEGKVKVLDFGIAKLVRSEVPAQQTTVVTQPGQAIGTPGYMSPEQALGKAIDHRSDIWSFGCVMYEMLTSRRPFLGETTSEVLESILTNEPDWQALPEEVPALLRDLIHKCLEKDPEKRYQSAVDLCQDLSDYQAILTAPAPKAVDIRALVRLLRKPRLTVCAVLVLMLFCIVALWLINRSAKVHWARVKAIPEIVRLIEQDKYLAAFFLARQAEKYIPKDPMLKELWPDMSRDYSIITTPSGADIFFKEYSAIDSQWQYLGQSPLENIMFPHGVYRWKITKDGFQTQECVAGGRATDPKPLNVDLWEAGKFPPGMLQIPPGLAKMTLWPFYPPPEAVEAPAYLIGRYEITNQQFKEFVEKGGYEKQEYWKHKFIKDGRELSWEQAVRQFRDKTSRAGPSTWEGGAYPKAQEKYPASGVSWYEAAAYAEFAGKSLPTIYHWSSAACTNEAVVIIPLSNFGGGGSAAVGSHPGMGRTGLYDMAGNVKEWCWNATDDSGTRRYILGGSWADQTYMFGHIDSRSPWDRSPDNGFRCVQYVDGKEKVPDVLLRPIEPPSVRDYSRETPVSDEEFQFYKKLYTYDRTELNAKVVSVDESSDYWRREKVTFDAAYAGERVIAYLFIPKGIKPPYQTVVYFPGWGVVGLRSFRPPDIMESIVMSGRAFMHPVYKGTFERQIPSGHPDFDQPNTYRDWVIQLSKDLGRSIDYLESRDDIDQERIAYYGVSWGARLGSIMLAVEDRPKAAILFLGGFHLFQKPPAADEFNFAPRVKVPVLMINGREDIIFPVKTCQIPMYEFLGTPEEDKEHKIYPGGHGLLGLFSKQIRGDVLGWLDRYLGPVD